MELLTKEKILVANMVRKNEAIRKAYQLILLFRKDVLVQTNKERAKAASDRWME